MIIRGSPAIYPASVPNSLLPPAISYHIEIHWTIPDHIRQYRQIIPTIKLTRLSRRPISRDTTATYWNLSLLRGRIFPQLGCVRANVGRRLSSLQTIRIDGSEALTYLQTLNPPREKTVASNSNLLHVIGRECEEKGSSSRDNDLNELLWFFLNLNSKTGDLGSLKTSKSKNVNVKTNWRACYTIAVGERVRLARRRRCEQAPSSNSKTSAAWLSSDGELRRRLMALSATQSFFNPLTIRGKDKKRHLMSCTIVFPGHPQGRLTRSTTCSGKMLAASGKNCDERKFTLTLTNLHLPTIYSEKLSLTHIYSGSLPEQESVYGPRAGPGPLGPRAPGILPPLPPPLDGPAY
ncbi:unnamed protein product [Nesidiocoris tenuis]|uniref:Uncharacterized protein n=1 Tax=Nesidiocoris tenuis TaxID=355587 RepID=A0A6H5G3F5_9HEMI|nr:unnamed protein product [Nesidiocoris tenuis]